MGKITVRLFEVWKRRESQVGHKLTYQQVQRDTGIALNTLVGWMNDRTTRFDESVLVRLCAYFDCEVGDLLVYVPDAEGST